VDSKSQVEELELQIREIIHRLLELSVTPHVRELRAKAVTYGRVIGNWMIYPPTQPQFQAMTECVSELDQKVKDATRDASAMLRESGRMPSSRGMKRHSAPPAIRPRAGSEFDAFEAALRGEDSDPTAVLSRTQTRAKKGSTKPPASSKTSSVAPSAHRPASDTRPTPIPALLQTRRSR